jgi:DNA-directed RNA polymerase subunit N (RpoN/RPB10)
MSFDLYHLLTDSPSKMAPNGLGISGERCRQMLLTIVTSLDEV